jgi:single-stranded-DNA-specific exonuclease
MATLDSDIGRFSLEETMFLRQPLLEVLAGRGTEDVDAFLKVPSWNDLPDPFSIPSMEKATARVLCAVRNRERITIFGDYDCDGVLGAHILRSVLSGLGAPARTFLPHRDEGYGLSSLAVHHFSCSGTDLLVTVDNGINARAAVRLAQRPGIDVVVIDHHRIQEQAETTAVWSDVFCGAGLAAMFAWALALSAGWNDTRVEHLLSGCSQYAAIASIADCVPLMNGTRTLARLGLAELSRSRHRGLQELLKSACTDPSQPDSRDVAFGVAPRINAAGRMAHPAEALAVFEAALDEEAARRSVDRLNHLNLERRRTVKLHFEELVESVGKEVPTGLVVYRAASPKGIAGLLASKCVERYSVPSIVLVPSTVTGQVVGSGRSVPGVNLVETLRPLGELFLRFGGHAQAIGLTMPVDHIKEFQDKFARSVEPMVRGDSQTLSAEAELNLSFVGRHFDEHLLLLEPFGEGNRPPKFSIRMAEVLSLRNKWVRIRQGRSSIEALCWDLPVAGHMKGDFVVEFYGKTRILRGYTPR